ncbi:uncharacterized protein LOC111403696 [Olea europaea var. sylvestris]|uniref:uncharacterized protein LOC111403696 n=1 Tax=Olea europaea var. sylvestris TaxID=158386 RepID=UPI000C1D5DCB|nr:uncharacterized protein LOC111403696 [Olea europaea var. sylvestris]
MNQVLHGFLDDFVVVYLDDIVIYNETLEERVQHVRQVFNRLRENELYAKSSKCSFAQRSISFLGHIIEQGKIFMDLKKVTSIKDWQPPKTVHDVRSFLELCNYYRKFVKGYSKIALSFTELIKKDKDSDWSSQCQTTFEMLKKSMWTNPILAFSDMSRPFEVHTDASDFALERRYSAHEKELLAVVQCLRGWRHYFLGSPFIVKTDDTAVSHFMSQPKLSSKQACWQEFLSEFNFILKYRPGSSNHIANALSRQADLAAICSVVALSESAVTKNTRDQIRALMEKDPTTQYLVDLIKQGKTRQFWLDGELVKRKGDRLYQDKLDHQKNAGLLEPLSIPTQPFESVSMDYIIELSKVEGFSTIIIMVNRLSKYVTFIAAPKYVSAEKQLISSSNILSNTGDCLKISSVIEILVSLKNWVKLLDAAQICFNVQKSSSTNKNHFEIVTGQQSLLPHTMDIERSTKSPQAKNFSQEWKRNIEIARSYLGKAQKRYKKSADLKRRFIEFNIENLVLHVSVLKPYFADKENASRNESKRPVFELRKVGKKVAETILDHRITRVSRKYHQEYLVKWIGCNSEENTWERENDLGAFKPLIETYHTLMYFKELELAIKGILFAQNLGDLFDNRVAFNFERSQMNHLRGLIQSTAPNIIADLTQIFHLCTHGYKFFKNSRLESKWMVSFSFSSVTATATVGGSSE